MAMTLIVMDPSWSRPEREEGEGERDREERRGRGTEKRGRGTDKRGGVKDREERGKVIDKERRIGTGTLPEVPLGDNGAAARTDLS